MIHNCYTCLADGYPVHEVLDMGAHAAVKAYVHAVAGEAFAGRLTVAVWKDSAWYGYFTVAPLSDRLSATRIETPACFEPLPCPKVTPAVTTPAFASCDPAAQQVAFMALERRVRELGAEAEDYRGAGNDDMADILVGHQEACVAAVKALREVAR